MLAPRNLNTVKLLHTTIWAIIATCIVANAFLGWAEMYVYALLLTGIVVLEIVVLAVNGWRCPLTNMAERYTDDRSDNFDIYLPLWLARNNKLIFGALFIVGELVVFLRLIWLKPN